MSASPVAKATPTVGNVHFEAVDYEAFEGDDPVPPVTVTADITGDLSRLENNTIYVGVDDVGQTYTSNPQLTLIGNGLGIQLLLFARGPNTKVGDLRSEVRVHVCMDSACRQPFIGSPFKVPYRLNVLPGLHIVEQGGINLSAKFDDSPLPSWRSAVSLPAGATKFGGVIYKRGFQIIFGGMDVTGDAGTLVVQGLPGHVGSRELDLYVEAVGITSTGRKVTLSQTRPVTYTITAPDKPAVIYTPASARLVRSSSSPQMFGSILEMMSPEVEPTYVSARIEYLDSSNGGLDDANGRSWLMLGDVRTRYIASDLLLRTELSYSLHVDCQLSGSRCVPPGSYMAKVILLTADGQPAPQPFLVRLDMEP